MFSLNDIKEKLFSMSDNTFRDFNARLIPNISKDTVIGVKTPHLRALAKEMYRSGECGEFLSLLPHEYFEENQLHAFIISEISDHGTALVELERFLPFIDNWATCDQLVMKAFKKSPEKILPKINGWLAAPHAYTVRFAIGHLMRYFLDSRFDRCYSDAVASIKSDDYYVNMMCAWYFATALAKQYDHIISYFEDNSLPHWVHNKAIQKARESYRVPIEHKEELLKLKKRG